MPPQIVDQRQAVLLRCNPLSCGLRTTPVLAKEPKQVARGSFAKPPDVMGNRGSSLLIKFCGRKKLK